MQVPRQDQVDAGPLLISVWAVCNSDDRLAGMGPVAQLISDFVDCSVRWSLEKASRRVLPFLLHRLARVEPTIHFVHAQCDRCHKFAACDGRLDEMIKLDALFPDLIISEAVTAAAAGGRLEILEWLYFRGASVCWRPDIAQIGARSGDVSVVRFLLERFPVTSVEGLHGILLVSIARGFDDIVEEVLPRFLRMCPSQEMVAALSARAPKKIARKIASGSSAPPPISIDKAAQRGDIAYVVWAQTQRVLATVKAMDYAASYGHLAMVQWLHRNRTEGCTTDAMDGAAAHGHFEVVRWLYDNRSEGCTDQAFFVAAYRGRLDIACWLFQMGLGRFPQSTFDHVCANGHLEVAKWLTAKRVGGGSTDAMDWAAAQNHLALVKWLHKNRDEGCTVLAVDAAACHGHLDVVRYLLDHRSEGCTPDAFDHAASNGHFAVLRWLDSINLAVNFTTAAMDGAAGCGRLDIVQWLHYHDNAVGCTTAAMDNAAARGNIDIVEWLHHHRGEGGTSRGADGAAMNGHIHVLEVFRRYRREQVSETAFQQCVRRGDLHTTRWIAAHFGETVDLQLVFQHSHNNGWTIHILRAAFFLGPGPF